MTSTTHIGAGFWFLLRLQPYLFCSRSESTQLADNPDVQDVTCPAIFVPRDRSSIFICQRWNLQWEELTDILKGSVLSEVTHSVTWGASLLQLEVHGGLEESLAKSFIYS